MGRQRTYAPYGSNGVRQPPRKLRKLPLKCEPGRGFQPYSADRKGRHIAVWAESGRRAKRTQAWFQTPAFQSDRRSNGRNGQAAFEQVVREDLAVRLSARRQRLPPEQSGS